MARKGSPCLGLDLGTSTVRAVVGDLNPDGTIEILGLGSHSSAGIKKGQIVNIEAAIENVQQAVEEAARMAGEAVDMTMTAISGNPIKGFNSRGVIAIKDKEVSAKDINRAMEAAQAVSIPPDREVIAIFPQEYILDGQEGIADPLGMVGSRLEVGVHIITASLTAARNLYKVCNQASLEVESLIPQSIAASKAVLHPDEQDMGVALVDIGGGTTDLAVYSRGSVRHTASLALGGDQITKDIAVGLRTSIQEAEKIKKRHGAALGSLTDPQEELEIEPVGGGQPRRLSRKVLADIINPRIEEILDLVGKEIERVGLWESIPAGFVLTGGTALLAGLRLLAEQVFSRHARIGQPLNVSGLVDMVSTPTMATAVGLIRTGVEGKILPFPGRRRGGWAAVSFRELLKKLWPSI